MRRILYVQPWNTSSYEDAAKLQHALDGLMIPRAMFEVGWRISSCGYALDLVDCNLIVLENPNNPVRAIEVAIEGYLAKHSYSAVFVSWPTVAQGNIVRHIVDTVRQ